MEILKGQSQPIAVLSPNPAVDMTYEIPQLIADQKVHATSTRFDPGGNGINVGRALKRLQTSAHNYCVIAGQIGQLLKQLLADQLDHVDCEEVEGETRINGTFIEREPPVQYEVSGIGPSIPPSQLNLLLNRFVEHSAGGFGVLTGSLQQELPVDLYASLVQRIHQQGGRAIVDSHDEALREAIAAHPFLIKPNRFELQILLGREFSHLESIAQAAREIQQTGVDYVCVSMDGDGALLVGPDNSYHAPAAAVVVRSSVGAGDSMVAALVAAFSRGHSPQQALRLGVACAAGTVSQPGTELFSPMDVENYYTAVSVTTLDI